MAVSKKRKNRGNGQRNITRYRQGVLSNVHKRNPAMIEKTLLNMFPWIGAFDEDDRKDCLADLSSATVAAAGDTNSEAFMATLTTWHNVYEKNFPELAEETEGIHVEVPTHVGK